MSDIWDVVKPLDRWERYYALMSFHHTGLKMVGATKIEVSDA